MLFNSYGFIFGFLPLSLVGFYSLGQFGRKPAASWLVFSSFVFYGLWKPRYIFLLALSICFNYLISLMIHANRQHHSLQRTYLILGIFVDIGVLIYYKYLVDIIGFTYGLSVYASPTPSITIPLGISFFTFTQIGYLVDVQQGVVADKSPLNYVLFVTFFPHLIAGPILHNREIMPQFSEKRTYRFSIENLTVGSVIFIIGLAKKCLLADPLSAQVSTGFAPSAPLTLPAAWLLMLTYAIQIYFDFSGYTDMAIGIARMFNVRFPMNFNSPYKATSIIDFWQRWHMTLTRLLTLYLFNPIAISIARSRAAGKLPISRSAQTSTNAFFMMTALPLLITMSVAGIWHGAGLKFLIFGLLHGFYLMVNHAWRIFRSPRAAKLVPLHRLSNWLLTISSILVALVFFRAPTMTSALATVSAMAGAHGLGGVVFRNLLLHAVSSIQLIFTQHGPAAATSGLKAIENAMQYFLTAFLWFIVLTMPNTQQIMHKYEPVLGRINPCALQRMTWKPTIASAAALGAIGAFAIMAVAGTTPFVYFQF